MYETLKKLDQDSINSILDLKNQVKFRSDNIRIGASGVSNRSVYTESKWYDWSREQKTQFQQALGNLIDTAVVGWFITFPIRGFLDKMDYWLDKTSAGTVVAYSLTDDNNITIDNETVILQKGEGVRFSLKQIHEVKTENRERSWVCLMQLL